jgi:hypothetical protein
MFGGWYERWCTQRMVADAEAAFSTADGNPPRSNPLQNLSRLDAICWAVMREYRVLRRFTIDAANVQAPVEFAAHLVALGPAFVKLGQVLSTRPDMLPSAYVEALAALQEKGSSVPSETIRDTLERELGRTLEKLFASFDHVPVAAASLAQVHRATLPDGTPLLLSVGANPNLSGSVFGRRQQAWSAWSDGAPSNPRDRGPH